MKTQEFNVETEVLDRLKDHEMTVELDDGVHRSIAFNRMVDGKPSMTYSFRLNTWPGHLAFSGDMGTFVFSRLRDMFEFFREDELKVNHGYWHEKLEAEDVRGNRGCGSTEYIPEMVPEYIDDCVEGGYITKEQAEELKNDGNWHDGEHNTYQQLYDFGRGLMDDPPNFRGYTWRFTWCLYAIVWGIQQYDASKKPQEKSTHPISSKLVGSASRRKYNG